MGESGSKDERMWGMLCHLSALGGYIIPFGNIIFPLIIWSSKRDEYPLVANQGKESLNFQITMMIGIAVSAVLMFVLIGIPLMILIGVANLILIVVASMKANEGLQYRYPFNFRLVK